MRKVMTALVTILILGVTASAWPGPMDWRYETPYGIESFQQTSLRMSGADGLSSSPVKVGWWREQIKGPISVLWMR